MLYPYFIDIETVPQMPDWEVVDPRTDAIYTKRFGHEAKMMFASQRDRILEENDMDYHYIQRAALYAEYGKIVCISIGIIVNSQLRIKTLTNVDELLLLVEFAGKVKGADSLCAHNGKEFDFPYLQRRMIVHNLEFPECLNTMGKKPWEVKNEDTKEMWSFGQYKSQTSLDCLCNLFGLPSPKTDMDGSMVREVFYEPCPADQLPADHERNKLKRIGDYCALDVVSLVQVYMKMKRLPLIKPENIVYV